MNRNFKNELAQWPRARIDQMIAQARSCDVEAALAREERTVHDLAALLSPHARAKLEPIAREAQRLTRWHFGRTIGLYVPIYLSNVCAADCLYCGFAAQSDSSLRRVTLSPDEIRRECEALAAHGFQNVLLLTGEAPRVTPIEYLVEAVTIAREYFASVSIEVYALDQEAYAVLSQSGLEGVTLYIETYDQAIYAKVHLAGLKQDYERRLTALEHAGTAGVRRLNLGVLLGLSDWRAEGFWMALNARHLQKQCWQSAVAISFPRLRHTPPRFTIPAPVKDAELVQLMLALRLFLPEVGFTLSTRESASLRDQLIPLGITLMSAGSSTRPGGYATCSADTLEQFEIEDTRSPSEVAQAIKRAGYDPVWKDFDHGFIDSSKV